MGFIEWLLAVWLGVTGLAIGSFLNVVIARVPEGQSIVRPGSKCPKCGHALRWYENIPLFSWLALRARCSNCKAPISIQYPLVELLTAVLFLAALARFGWTWPLAPALVFLIIVIPLIVIDALLWILPFELTLPGIALGVLMQLPLGLDAVIASALGVVFGFLAFRLFEIFGWFAFRREAMGAGDKYLVAMVGAFLTWKVLLAIVFLSSLQGAVFGLARIALTGRAAAATEPPADPNAPPEPEPPPDKMSWAFLAPGLSLPRRLWLLPYSLLFQPIPDERVDEATGEEIEWQPEATNLPFGPWIGLAAIEMMLFAPWVAERVPMAGLGWAFGL